MPKIVNVRVRRICWPNPDATCLEGGCLYCDENPLRPLGEIARYVDTAGVLPNRGIGSKPAREAWQIGLDHDFYNADSRTVPKRVPD